MFMGGMVISPFLYSSFFPLSFFNFEEDIHVGFS